MAALSSPPEVTGLFINTSGKNRLWPTRMRCHVFPGLAVRDERNPDLIPPVRYRSLIRILRRHDEYPWPRGCSDRFAVWLRSRKIESKLEQLVPSDMHVLTHDSRHND